MLKMQAFYTQLSTAESTTAHQHSLASLARLTRIQIVDATRDMTWLIWESAEAIPA